MLSLPLSQSSYGKTLLKDPLLASNQQSRQKIQDLKKQLKSILVVFEEFKDSTLSQLHDCMGRISTMLYRSLREKNFLENQLQKSRQVQNIMRAEVIQLKEMINEALIDYGKDLQAKDAQINDLKAQLLHLSNKSHHFPEEDTKTEENHNSEQTLEIIQEESEQATYSSANSLREFKDEEKDSFDKENISIIPQSHCTGNKSKQLFEPVEQPPLSECKGTKSFIDNFRKTIEQSFQSKKEEDKRVVVKLQMKGQKQNNTAVLVSSSFFQDHGEPLHEISSNQKQQVCRGTKLKQKQTTKSLVKVFFPNKEENSLQQSQISEISKLSGIEQQSEILPVKKFETPNSLFFKKSSNTCQRFKTEPSEPAVNTCYSSKTCQMKGQKRSFSDGKSIKTSVSKEKIKVTSRMVEQMNYHPRKNHGSNTAKAVVYLGGKSAFRKFLNELKNSFRRFQIIPFYEELKYEGDIRNMQKWGKGRLTYRNGMVYHGDFRQNMRNGRGSLSLNGISLYQGEWANDQVHGEGYIKCLRLLSTNCPVAFQQASYCGHLQLNKFHGIGTIFLNQKEKIVTKFVNGCPVGELTYYNLHEIQFGVWPSD